MHGCRAVHNPNRGGQQEVEVGTREFGTLSLPSKLDAIYLEPYLQQGAMNCFFGSSMRPCPNDLW